MNFDCSSSCHCFFVTFKDMLFYFKRSKYRLPSQIDFNKCKEEIAIALNEFVNDGAEEKKLSVML